MSQADTLSIKRSVQRDENAFHHGVQILRNVRIPKPDDAIPLLLEPELPRPIASGILHPHCDVRRRTR
jgi:hypothetical protein